MSAIYKREMRAFFKTPVGYVFSAIFLAASGFLFSFSCLRSKTTDVSGYYVMLMFAYVVIIPLLTMKSFAEERRQGTEQLLMTSPVSIVKLVASKFLACFTVFAITLAVSTFYFIPLFIYGDPNVGRIFGCLVGMTLIAVCFIAIGLFVSSLTQNQFVAAMGTIGILTFFLALGLVEDYVNSGFIKTIIGWVSIYSRFNYFTYGLFDLSAAVYYVSVAAIFLFLTVRVIERRRYA
ncbi:MAG: ABC transporter permease subunit [Clostridia bacterium]|nr:ABC transporter permease subunit [Clostridia bacterium]